MTSAAKIPLSVFRLPASAGARLLLVDLYAHAADHALVDYLAGKGAPPFSSRTLGELERDHGYSRSQVHRAMQALMKLGKVRRAGRVVDGKIVRGFELLAAEPEPAPAPALDSRTVVERAEDVITAIFSARAELGVRLPVQRPTTAEDVALVMAPLGRLGVSWDAWALVIERCVAEVRRQAADGGGDVRRAASLPYLTLPGLAGANFARYLKQGTGQ